MNYNRILITGGAGFIGSHLVDLFDKINVDYLVLDNFSSGSSDNISAAVAKNCFIQGDVNDESLMECLINSASCVIHLASIVGVKNVMHKPLDVIDTNINALRFIAKSCSLKGIPLVYFSSSLVYPPPNCDCSYFSENMETHTLGFHPVSIYVTSKMTGELICKHYQEILGLKFIICRPFNLIGPRQNGNSGMVVPSFIRSALNSGIINVYGSGEQKRSFSDVKTAVKLLWELILNERSVGEIFNLATNNTSISIQELADFVKIQLNKDIRINRIPYNQVYGENYRDVQFRSPSLTKLKKYVSPWRERSIEEIIMEIIEFEKTPVTISS